MNLEISGNGKILQEELKLDNNCSFSSVCNFEELNRGDLIKIKVKLSGDSLESPYTIPFENYILKSDDNNSKLDITFLNMYLKSIKEVYYYSYEMIFRAESIIWGNNEKITRLEFSIPNLIIGYDDMKISDKIINYTNLELKFRNKNYKIQLEGNSDFNDSFTNISAQTNFTSKIKIESDSELNYDDCIDLANNLNNLISIAYGSLRPYLMIEGFLDDILVYKKLEQKRYSDSSEPINLINIKYSSILSDFIIKYFDSFSKLEENTKLALIKLINNFSNMSKIINKESFNLFVYMIEDFYNRFYKQKQTFILSFKTILEKYNVEYDYKKIEYLEINMNKGYLYQDYTILYENISYFKKFIINFLE
jgi:hypothetical protein